MAKIHFASNGKRDLHNLEQEYDNSFEKLENTDKWIYDNNRKIIIDYLNACRRGKAKSGKANKRVGKSTLVRVLGILRLLSEEWIKKNFDDVTDAEWERFYEDMEDGKYKNTYGNNYKQTTKAKNYKTIRKFLKFKYGENNFYPQYCEDWVTAENTPTKEYLTRAEVEKVINSTNSLKIKCLIFMLFDGGFRVEELSNLRWVDLTKLEGKEYYKAHIRAETSKTKKERYVSLWLATDMIESFKNHEKHRLCIEFNESDFIFKASYNNIYMTINRIGKKILNKNVSPHTLRHSSATYYASIIKTYQHFCVRYGWSLNSDSPQRYFHSISDDEIANQTKDHEIARFKTEFERLNIQNKYLTTQLEEVQRKMVKYDAVFEILDKRNMLEINIQR